MLPPWQLVDVIALANQAALQSNPPRYPAHAERESQPITDPDVLKTMAESTDEIRSLLAALRG